MSEPRPDRSDDAQLVPSTTPASDDVAAAALARVRDVTGELMRLVRSAATQATDGWSLVAVLRPIVPELERVFEERETLDQEVQLLRTDVADADERIRELDTQLAAREAGWTAERAMLETEVGRERDQVQMLTQDLERRRAEGELLATRERRVREQMEAVAARAHADREETLRLARDMVQSAEDARLAVVDEMDRLRAALAAEQASLVEVQQERALVSQDAAQREAELARARQMIEQIEASRTNANGELARARAKLVATESDLLAAQHEYQLAQVQIDKLCSAQDDMVEDRAQLVARLHDAKEREARLRLRIASLEQRIQSVHEGTAAPSPDTPPESALDATASGLALELSRAEERARVLETELVKAKAAASAAMLRVDALQEQARTAEQARIAAETELRRAEQARTAAEMELRRVREAAVPLVPPSTAADATAIAAPVAEVRPEAETVDVEPQWPTAASPGRFEVVEEQAGVDEDAACTSLELEPIVPASDVDETDATDDVIETSAVDDVIETMPSWSSDPPPDDTVAEPAAADDEHAETSSTIATSVAVIDGTGAWSGDDAIAVHALSPDDATCDRLRDLAPSCCLVNLGVPGAIEAISALRAGDITTAICGCVVDGTHAIALGRFDVLARPVEPERVRARLEALAPRGANVIMVGSESGILIPLRQGVQQAGMSVKTAWNRAQAVQLADTVHPDVVIVDVAAEATETASLLCDLARRVDAPKLVLVVGTPAHQEELRGALIGAARDASAVDRAALLHAAASVAQG